MTTKTKKVKARKFWGYPAQVKQGEAYITTKQAGVNQDVRLWLFPATPEAYDAMVEQMADAWDRQLGFPIRNPNGRHFRILRIHAMLAAIGIKEPTK